MRRFLFLSLIVVAASPAAALEFRLLSWAGEISGLHYASGPASVPVVADENLLSPAYQFPGPGPLVLFRETTADGKTVRVPVATLTPPDGLTHAVLLLSATDASRTAFTGVWMDDSVETRPAQTITYRNFSSYTVAIRLGDREHSVAPQSFYIHRAGGTTERMVLKAAARTPDGWEIIASTSQTVRPGRRTLVLLRDGRPQPNGHTDRIDFLVFNDRPPAPPAAVR